MFNEEIGQFRKELGGMKSVIANTFEEELKTSPSVGSPGMRHSKRK
jgi:hypothetical protein